MSGFRVNFFCTASPATFDGMWTAIANFTTTGTGATEPTPFSSTTQCVVRLTVLGTGSRPLILTSNSIDGFNLSSDDDPGGDDPAGHHRRSASGSFRPRLREAGQGEVHGDAPRSKVIPPDSGSLAAPVGGKIPRPLALTARVAASSSRPASRRHRSR